MRKHRLSEEEAFDAYSDSVLVAIGSISNETFKAESSLKSYLYKIFHNKCVDLFRKNSTNKNSVRMKLCRKRSCFICSRTSGVICCHVIGRIWCLSAIRSRLKLNRLTLSHEITRRYFPGPMVPDRRMECRKMENARLSPPGEGRLRPQRRRVGKYAFRSPDRRISPATQTECGCTRYNHGAHHGR